MPFMPCAWKWKDLGGATRVEHLVVNTLRRFCILMCGMRLEPDHPVGRPNPLPKCRRCLTALRSQMADGLKLMPVHDVDAIARKATRSARLVEERLHQGTDD